MTEPLLEGGVSRKEWGETCDGAAFGLLAPLAAGKSEGELNALCDEIEGFLAIRRMIGRGVEAG